MHLVGFIIRFITMHGHLNSTYSTKHCVMSAYDMKEWRYNSTHILNFDIRWVRLLASRPIRLVFREEASGTIQWTVHGYQKGSVRMV